MCTSTTREVRFTRKASETLPFSEPRLFSSFCTKHHSQNSDEANLHSYKNKLVSKGKNLLLRINSKSYGKPHLRCLGLHLACPNFHKVHQIWHQVSLIFPILMCFSANLLAFFRDLPAASTGSFIASIVVSWTNCIFFSKKMRKKPELQKGFSREEIGKERIKKKLREGKERRWLLKRKRKKEGKKISLLLQI